MNLDLNQKGNIPLTTYQFLDQIVVFLWRLGLGKAFNIFPSVFGKIMVVKHRGRIDGKNHYLPLSYSEKDGLIYCTSLLNQSSDWAKNLEENPMLEVWMVDGWFTARAEILDDPIDRLIHFREILSKSEIPARFFGLNHSSMTDQEMSAKTENHILARIQRQAPQTGRDGPGGLAWLWPFITIFLVLKRKRRK